MAAPSQRFQSTQEADKSFLSRHKDTINELRFISSSQVRDLYTLIAAKKHSTPLYVFLGDMIVIWVIAARSGIRFEDNEDTLSILRSVLLNGVSGSGKTQAITYATTRLQMLQRNIITFFDQTNHWQFIKKYTQEYQPHTQDKHSRNRRKKCMNNNQLNSIDEIETTNNLEINANKEEKEDEIDDIDMNETAKHSRHKPLVANDIEMTPHPNARNIDVDQTEILELHYSRVEYLRKYWEIKISPSADLAMEIQGNTIKALVQMIIKKRGEGLVIKNELRKFLSQMTRQGDKNGGQFICSLGDTVIDAFRYSTAKLSTPRLSGCNVALLSGATSGTVHDLLTEVGVDGCNRRIYTMISPLNAIHPAKYTKLYRHQNIPTELEDWRLFQFWHWLHIDGETGILRSSIPCMPLGKITDLIQKKNTYYWKNKESLDGFKYPQKYYKSSKLSLEEDNTNINWRMMTPDDILYELKVMQSEAAQNENSSELSKNLINDAITRWCSLAYGITIRYALMKMKKQGENIGYRQNEPFNIEINAAVDARCVSKLFNEYIESLTNVVHPHGSGSSNQSVQIMKKLQYRIMDKLIRWTGGSDECISSQDLGKRVWTQTYKGCNVMNEIQSICNLLHTKFNLIELEDMENKENVKNKGMSQNIFRKAISSVHSEWTDDKKKELVQTLQSFGSSVHNWSAPYGMKEIISTKCYEKL